MPSLWTSPPSFFFPQLCMLSMLSYGMEYPFGQLGSAVPAVSPPNFLCTPSLLAGGVGWGAEKALTQCEHCSAVTKTSLNYQHCFQHYSKHSPMLATVKKINSIPAKTSTALQKKICIYDANVISLWTIKMDYSHFRGKGRLCSQNKALNCWGQCRKGKINLLDQAASW